MFRHRLLLLLCLTLIGLPGEATSRLFEATTAELPAALSNQEFWQLTQDLSEPDGTFRSENLVSNEMVLWRLVPLLVRGTKPGGAYMGVGPEQNFSYIAAIRPRMAFITDIRRGNLQLLLLYKALFELSTDRAEFVSRLFTRTRPAGVSAASSVWTLMDQIWAAAADDETAFSANLAAVQRQLTKTRRLPLPAEDLDAISKLYRTFFRYGPAITYETSTAVLPAPATHSESTRIAATYRDLMTQSDSSGGALSYLASEDTFAFVKDLFARNLIVPVVGNFSGPKSIRAIGTYVRNHGATVTAFYLSNVEPYLRDDGSLPTFCASVATLPMDNTSVLIKTGNAGSLPVDDPAVFDRPVGQPLKPSVATPAIGTFLTGVVLPMATRCGK